jgi:hypothetical protein
VREGSQQRLGGLAVLAVVGLLAAVPAAAQTLSINYIHTELPPCPDCDADGAVTVDELVTHVGIALATTPLAACSVADADGDGVVAVYEVVGGVQAALDGCGLDEVLVADSTGGEHLEVTRSGDWLRMVASRASGQELEISVGIADWQVGRAYAISVAWDESGAALYVDGELVGRQS